MGLSASAEPFKFFNLIETRLKCPSYLNQLQHVGDGETTQFILQAAALQIDELTS